MKIIIDIYETNGQEPELKDFLEEQKNANLKDKDVIMTMIRCNFEKPMLEDMVETIDSIPATNTRVNSVASYDKNAMLTKVVEKRRKNKI